MHRQHLAQLLQQHKSWDAQEEASLQLTRKFITHHDDCFHRSCVPGHITASVWLLNDKGNKVLLTHHKKLHMWLQLGGHCDGQSNVLDAAMREAQEESGLANLIFKSTDIFDVDIHPIPAYGSEPEHYHYDVIFLIQATDNAPFVISDESHDLQWFDINAKSFPFESPRMFRLFDKWKNMD